MNDSFKRMTSLVFGGGLAMLAAWVVASVLSGTKSMPLPDGPFAPIASAPALQVSQWVKGEPVTLGAPDAKIVVVDMWATWCKPCRGFIPHTTELQRKYRDQGVVIVGLTAGEEPETVASFVRALGDEMDYTIALDENMATALAYYRITGVEGIPYTYLVNRTGEIVWHGHPMDVGPAIEHLLATS
jgi:thiol-disulfide isomerase/thioredoxin